MKAPTIAEAGRFILIVLGVLLVLAIARFFFFGGGNEAIGAIDVVVAIATAVVVMGGWLRPGKGQSS